jgi:hypothetical protein
MTESRGPPDTLRFQLALQMVEDSLAAVEVERERLSEDQWKVDATFFIYALRDLLRYTELAERSAPPTAASDMRRELEKFNAAVPNLVDLRDVLEHSDAYLEMKGNLQHAPGTRERKRKPESAIDPWEGKRPRRAPPGSFGFWAARQTDDDLLVGAGELELRVEVAFRAAQEMATAILAHRPEQ